VKYDIKQRKLDARTKARIAALVGARGDAGAVLSATEDALAKKRTRAWFDADIKRGRAVKHHARSLLLALESVRPELRREVNEMMVDIILGRSFNEILKYDYLSSLTIALRARVKGRASRLVGRVKLTASHEENKFDLPSINIVSALAHAWQNHTRLAVSGADGAPFVEFVSTVLTATGSEAVADPRRIINHVLKSEPELRKRHKK
jgi:hypothetical protein